MDAAARQTILEAAGVEFAPGLTDSEIVAVQDRWGFVFPPDLRDFLSYALPVSEKWVDWRNGDEAVIQHWLDWPFEGICFDIEHADFWCASWGDRPAPLHEAFSVARQMLDLAPRLIPVLPHRFIPDRPSLPGNPVFSVWQTDIVHYGSDLQNYLENEFWRYFGTPKYHIPAPVRRIELWTCLATLAVKGDC